MSPGGRASSWQWRTSAPADMEPPRVRGRICHDNSAPNLGAACARTSPMTTTQLRQESPPSILQLHARFLNLLPKMERYVRFHFRSIPCPHRQADALAEASALCWKWFVVLAGRGRAAAEFPTALASFAVRAVRSGRRLAGQERACDVYSPMAQSRGNFAVAAFIDQCASGVGVLGPALRYNVVTPSARPSAVPLRLSGLAQTTVIGQTTDGG